MKKTVWKGSVVNIKKDCHLGFLEKPVWIHLHTHSIHTVELDNKNYNLALTKYLFTSTDT